MKVILHTVCQHLFAWPECHAKTEVELEMLTDVDISLIVEKGIRERMCHAIGMQKPTTNTKRDYDLSTESSYSCTGMSKTCTDWFKFADEFIQDYDEVSDKEYVLEVDFKYLKELRSIQ